MGGVKRTKAQQQVHDATWVLIIAGLFPFSILGFSVCKSIGAVNWWWFWTTLVPVTLMTIFATAVISVMIYDTCHWIAGRISEYSRNHRKSINNNS